MIHGRNRPQSFVFGRSDFKTYGSLSDEVIVVESFSARSKNLRSGFGAAVSLSLVSRIVTGVKQSTRVAT
jgi:hypothetical protein